MFMTVNLRIRLVSIFAVFLIMLSVFAPCAAALEQPASVEGTAAILVEPSTGTIMYEQNAYDAVIPASTTKVMTALLVFEAIARGQITLDDEVTATQAIIDGVIFDASRVSPYIADGEVMTVKQYLQCVLLSSDCVACDILGNYVSGSVENFIALMNQRASELGCRNSCFKNSHGYPVEGHYSCAYDLYLICAEAIKYDAFREIFGTIKMTLPATNKNPERKLYNTNFTLWNPEKITSIYCDYYYEFATGGKTGSSNASGHCLVSTAEKDGMTLICVVTGSPMNSKAEDGSTVNKSFIESVRLYEWGFENFRHTTVVAQGSVQGSVMIKKSEVTEMSIVAERGLSMTLPTGAEEGIEKETVVYNEEVKAPVSAGDVLGELIVKRNGETIDTIKLLASIPAPAKKGAGPLAVLLIITVIVAAGLMLYIVNSDNPAFLKQYKPESTYKNSKRSGSGQPRGQNQQRQKTASNGYQQRSQSGAGSSQQRRQDPYGNDYYSAGSRNNYRSSGSSGKSSTNTRDNIRRR